MKKSRLLLAAVALGMASLASCAMEDVCQDCDVVVYDLDSGLEKSRTPAAEYCGDDLTDIQQNGASIIGLDSSVYECHE